MDNYDLILGIPLIEKHEPWIGECDKAIWASRFAVSDRALMIHLPTSVRDWCVQGGYQNAYGPREVMGSADSNENAAMSLTTGRETRLIAGCPQASETAVGSAKGVSSVGNIGPQAGSILPQAAESAEESAEGVSGVGNITPREVDET
ncbi:Gag protein [Phytophthora palmivora]|uniref:Gag protein n=1 Tax=Phytophthora palmivora TaxID=4796 RepID=A0A2P4WY72_9STRA|nr:Gag protein [Phytophthora palmivora]